MMFLEDNGFVVFIVQPVVEFSHGVGTCYAPLVLGFNMTHLQLLVDTTLVAVPTISVLGVAGAITVGYSVGHILPRSFSRYRVVIWSSCGNKTKQFLFLLLCHKILFF